MRRYILAANWKMNKTFDEANEFLDEMTTWMESNKNRLENIDVAICPPFPYLEMTTDFADELEFYVGAQDVSAHESGAYTGEVAAQMLESIGITFCIIGHSERRQYHGETDAVVNAKLMRLMETTVIPIVCIGEREEERTAGQTSEVLLRQLNGAFNDIAFGDETAVVIAYEPVWAIGTGKTATPEIAQEAHSFIRKWVAERFGERVSLIIPILYGGSMTPENIEGLLSQPDIDGGLIGGASLDVKKFTKMMDSAVKVSARS
jgi:triosephosphate isomerase